MLDAGHMGETATFSLFARAPARTKRIRLTSAVTVRSSDDPVRVYHCRANGVRLSPRTLKAKPDWIQAATRF